MAEVAAPLTERQQAAAGSDRLWGLLARFGLGDGADFGTGRGTWVVLQDDEDGPEVELAPDIADYLENLAWVARGAGTLDLRFRCSVVGSNRRVWLTIVYDPEDEEWYYEYPGERDWTAFEADVARAEAEETR